MRRPVAFAVVVATVASVLSLLLSAPARADEPTPPAPPAPGVLMTTSEQDCHEVLYPRGARIGEVQKLLGPHWTAEAGAPDVAYLYLVDYVCERTTVDGVFGPRRTVTSFALTRATRQGDPTTRFYLLWWGTDNPQVHVRMRLAGLPAKFVPVSSATLTADGATTVVRYDIVGAGLTHWLSVSEPTIPMGEIEDQPAGDFGYWNETASGDVRLAYSNLAYPPFGATLTGDFRKSSVIDRLFLEGATRTPDGVTRGVSAVVGSWTGVLYAPTG